jgi:hypothetical protein
MVLSGLRLAWRISLAGAVGGTLYADSRRCLCNGFSPLLKAFGFVARFRHGDTDAQMPPTGAPPESRIAAGIAKYFPELATARIDYRRGGKTPVATDC